MTDLQSFTLMMASAQVVETSVNTNNSSSQDYTTNPDDHSNHNIAYILRINLQFLVVRTGRVRACKCQDFLGSGLECTAIAIVFQNYTS